MLRKIIRNIKIALKAGKNAPAFIYLKAASAFSRISGRTKAKPSLLASPPRFVYIGPTFHCNLKCPFCLEHSPLELERGSPFYKGDKSKGREYLNAQMDFTVFKRLVDDIYDLGTQYVYLCGYGEPMLHPDFLKMCGYIKNKGLKCYIETNGTLLTKDKVKYLVDIGVDTICISLNSGTPEVYQEVHGAEKSVFPQIIENLRFLADLKKSSKREKPVISMGNVICKANFRDAISMVKAAIDSGAQRVNFINLMYCLGRKELLKSVLLNEEDVVLLKGLALEALLLAQRNSLENNIPSFLGKLNNPGSGRFLAQEKHILACQVQADGIVAPHDFPYDIGKVNGARFAEIWYSPKYLQFRRSILNSARAKEVISAYPFCRRCNAPLHNKKLCASQC